MVAVVPQVCTTHLALKWTPITLSSVLPLLAMATSSLHPELAVLFHWLFSGRDSGLSFVGRGTGP